MKYTDVAIQDLQKYNTLKNSLDNIADKIKLLDDNYTSINSFNNTHIPTEGGGSKREEQLLDNIVERQRLEINYNNNLKLIHIIEKGLKAITDDERLVLEYFYINRPSNHIKKLMTILNFEKSQIYNLKSKALYNFTINMYGVIDF